MYKPQFRKHFLLVCGILCLFCLSACSLNGFSLFSGPTVKWKVHIGISPNTRIEAPVEVADGTVFVAAGESQPGRKPWGEVHYLQALDASNGQFKWHMEVRGTSAAKPVYQNGIVIFSSVSFAPLYGIDAKTGAPMWEFSASGDFPTVPVVKDGIVYMACACRRYAGLGPNGRVLAIDIQSGKSKWEIDLDRPKDISPAVSADTVYYVDGDGLHAVSRELGKQIWTLSSQQPIINSIPVVVNNTLYFDAPLDGMPQLFILDAKTGIEEWHIGIEKGVIRSISILNDTAYVETFDFCDMFCFRATNFLYAIDLKTRQVKWRFDDVSRMGVIEDNGIVYFSSGKTLYAVDGETGKAKWTFGSGQYWQAPTLADGIIYIGGDKGDLYALSVR